MGERLEGEKSTARVGVPPLLFLFTIDQIASMLNISEKRVRESYLFYQGRSTGIMPRHQMRAVNIAPASEKADWRISNREFISWAKRMGFKLYDFTQLK